MICRRCGKVIASAVEEAALRKLAKADPMEAQRLSLARCRCRSGPASLFTSSVQPSDLQSHDKFDK